MQTSGTLYNKYQVVGSKKALSAVDSIADRTFFLYSSKWKYRLKATFMYLRLNKEGIMAVLRQAIKTMKRGNLQVLLNKEADITLMHLLLEV